eukprot:1147694-Pelagomonas_calceolata.AAC.17
MHTVQGRLDPCTRLSAQHRRRRLTHNSLTDEPEASADLNFAIAFLAKDAGNGIRLDGRNAPRHALDPECTSNVSCKVLSLSIVEWAYQTLHHVLTNKRPKACQHLPTTYAFSLASSRPFCSPTTLCSHQVEDLRTGRTPPEDHPLLNTSPLPHETLPASCANSLPQSDLAWCQRGGYPGGLQGGVSEGSQRSPRSPGCEGESQRSGNPGPALAEAGNAKPEPAKG